MTTSSATTRNPWAWVPTLYFAQGIPYVVAMSVSVIMYKRMGISNTDIALYTSWLYLPWVIKPLWSPLVDLFRTKRLWIVTMQALIGAMLACVALTIPLPHFFQYTIVILWLMAFSSATHDIAADGFYMLGLEEHQQAAFVGVRSTFYRIAMISGQGILVVLAGLIEGSSGLPPSELHVVSKPDAANVAITYPDSLPVTPSDGGLAVIAEPRTLEISTITRSRQETASIVAKVRERNLRNGFYSAAEATTPKESTWWSRVTSEPVKKLEDYLRAHFGEQRAAKVDHTGNVGVVTLHLSNKPEPGRSVVVVLDRASGNTSIGLSEGTRFVFDEHNWNKPAMAVFQLDAKLKAETQATFSATSGNIPLAWTTVFVVLAVLFVMFCVYHKFILPRPSVDHAARAGGAESFARTFFRTFAKFFRKRNIAIALCFLLLYRFAEAQLVKLISPFLLDPREAGGLGLTTSQVGIAYGTCGVGALMCGGLLGGYFISRQGLKFWLWPMIVIINLGGWVYLFLAYVQPESFPLTCTAVAVEQFGYGFGFTAYMLYMIMVAEGEHKTAHYALCTGFMALGMMIPGMFSGWLQDLIGYRHFFIWVLISTIPGMVVASLLKIDPEFGRKKAAPPVCPSCGYTLAGDGSGTCPECGVPVPALGAATKA
jgi:PAT family beta-lactamase induction signal transducer AmpG